MDNHLSITHHYLYDLANPPTSTYDLCTTHTALTDPCSGFSRSSNLLTANHFNDPGKAFQHAYDTTTSLRPWAQMEGDKIDATSIRFNSIVLIECYFKRYRPPNTPSTPENHWPSWKVTLELTRVATLLRTASQAPLPQDSHVNL